MTNEEMVYYLEHADITVGQKCKTKTAEAIEEALKMIKQQPCEDCVEREDAKKFLYERLDRLNDDVLYDIFSKIIDDMYNELPSVQPQLRRGEWIRNWCEWQQYLECSKCGYETGLRCDTNYCPNCGADMREVQDGK